MWVWIGTLGVACFVGVLAGCAGTGMPANVVVEVGSTHIEKSSVEHWMSVVAASAYAPGQPAPQIPDPPSYSKCIAYKRRYDPRPAAAHSVSPPGSQLKAECTLEYERDKLKALYFLISVAWLSGKAAELGISADTRAVQQQLLAFRRSFRSPAAYRQYLAATHVSAADMLMRAKLELVTGEIQKRIEAQSGARSESLSMAALHRFARAFKKQWRAKTSCRAGYVVQICKQYKPPRKPSVLVPPSVPLAG